MLSFIFTDINDERITLDNPIYAVINQDEKIPADDLTVTFPYIEKLSELSGVEVYDGDKIVFKGVVDEQQSVLGVKEYYTRIAARSMAAVLLDNESRPVNYTKPTTSVIFEKHLSPNSITKYKGEEKALNENLNVPKGTSDWQVFYNFCIKAFNRAPRIEADGTASFIGVNSDDKVLFSNNGGVSYNSIKENIKRCKLISDVNVKAGNSGYNMVINDKSIKDRKIKRKRYYDASVNKDFTVPDIMIRNSLDNSYEVTVVSPERIIDKLGAKAEIENEKTGTIKGLYISSVYYRLTTEKEETTLILKKEREYVDS
ncbi:MAG: hypothetical protein IJ903_06010 [Ruminococcus sp.]|nr:hypothetical protein [Ruminococcus sp.]